ncbi:hypothetical protein [Pedobacter caeni]
MEEQGVNILYLWLGMPN